MEKTFGQTFHLSKKNRTLYSKVIAQEWIILRVSNGILSQEHSSSFDGT